MNFLTLKTFLGIACICRLSLGDVIDADNQIACERASCERGELECLAWAFCCVLCVALLTMMCLWMEIKQFYGVCNQ